MFCKKGVLRKFTKFTGKHLCQTLFFNKVAGLRAATLSKKRLWHRCFTVNFTKFIRTIFFTEHLWWLLQIRVTNKILKCLFFSDESLDKQKTKKLLTFISVIHEKTKINWYHQIFGYQRLIFFSQPFYCPNTKFVLGGGGRGGGLLPSTVVPVILTQGSPRAPPGDLNFKLDRALSIVLSVPISSAVP